MKKIVFNIVIIIIQNNILLANVNNYSNFNNIQKISESRSSKLQPNSNNFLTKLYGNARSDIILYTGMWSWHPETLTEKHNYNNNNKALGLAYKGIIASRFKNSFNDVSYILGIQREWYNNKLYQDLEISAGYRLGLIYGYKPGTTPLAKYSPILPLPGLTTKAIYNHVGVEASINAYVISGTFIFSF